MGEVREHYVFEGIDGFKTNATATVQARNGDVVIVHAHRKGEDCNPLQVQYCFRYEGDTCAPYDGDASKEE